MKQHFNIDYPSADYLLKNVLKPALGEYKLHNENALANNPQYKNAAQQSGINKIVRVAEFQVGITPVSVFDITLSDNARISQARVNIQRVVRSLQAVFTGSLMLFHYENGEGKEWRISFMEKGETLTATSMPRRYTYLCGKMHQCRTVGERFEILKKTPEKSVAEILKAFSVETLTKDFYKELFLWYTWALLDEIGVTYPNDTSTEADDRIVQEHLIRLITRLMFVWFIKQKHLIPDEIFDSENLSEILQNFNPTDSKTGNYYNAILQNLFFATLNRPINERAFAVNGGGKGNEHYGIKTLYRDAMEGSYFKKTHDEIIQLFKSVPFLNGGLFECLDKEKDNKGIIMYTDGFSRAKGKQKRAFLPNILFFEPEKGLINILKRYNFTIEENTPQDVEVALDPELLGKVFENLLGAYNLETRETARKQSGSFYTPREIVNYMVDESLKAYLQQSTSIEIPYFENMEFLKTDGEKSAIYKALLKIKILDPACGSGAFPMGVLNRTIEIMERLGLPQTINRYQLKLHLIENCIFGVDIQTIAVQISKLRFLKFQK